MGEEIICMRLKRQKAINFLLVCQLNSGEMSGSSEVSVHLLHAVYEHIHTRVSQEY